MQFILSKLWENNVEIKELPSKNLLAIEEDVEDVLYHQGLSYVIKEIKTDSHPRSRSVDKLAKELKNLMLIF